MTAAVLVLAGSLALMAPASAGPPAGPGHAPSGTVRHSAEPAGTGQGTTRVAYRNACGPAGPNQARCLALFATGPPAPATRPQATPGTAAPSTATPTQTVAYGPAELRAAYAIPSDGGDGQTVAMVIAYDHPNAEADLAQYRAHFGLPPCTTANGCFRKMSQRGDSVLPRADVAWAQEASVDLDMVSAVCPRCHILLVEADTSNLANLVVAVSQAASRGATVINNSYGVPESSAVRRYNDAYNLPGHTITAATGDGGYRVYFPASSQFVTAVSGTTLTRSSSGRGWNEAVWGGTGSGCSTLFTKPAWQADKGCPKHAAVTCAPPRPATMGPPASARRTASEPSRPADPAPSPMKAPASPGPSARLAPRGALRDARYRDGTVEKRCACGSA